MPFRREDEWNRFPCFEAAVSAAVAAKEDEWRAAEEAMAEREAAAAETAAHAAAIDTQLAQLW